MGNENRWKVREKDFVISFKILFWTYSLITTNVRRNVHVRRNLIYDKENDK